MPTNRPPTAASSSSTNAPSTTEANFRLSLTTISIDRVDRSPEDDFKTWAQTVVVTGSRLSSRFWFAGDEKEINLGKTSVVGGNEHAPYSFARNSKDFPVDNSTLSEFSSSFLQVSRHMHKQSRHLYLLLTIDSCILSLFSSSPLSS